jgi:hypothetical protein
LLVLDDLIGQSHQLGLQLEQLGAGFVGALPSGGQLAHPGALGRRDWVELVLASFAAGQHPGGMQVALGAAAGGLTTLAAQEVETAGNEFGPGAHQTQEVAGGAEVAPELAAEWASRSGHLYLYNIKQIQIASTKVQFLAKR